MKHWGSICIWAIMLFSLPPTTMALASWNAIPGDSTYPWKIILERALLFVMSPSSSLQSQTQMKLTERRLAEMRLSMDGEYAVTSLQNLNQQVDQTGEELLQIQQAERKRALIDQYLATLNTVSLDLVDQQRAVQEKIAVADSGNSPTNTVTAPSKMTTSTKNPSTRTTSATQNSTTQTVVVVQDQSAVLAEIQATQAEIALAMSQLEAARAQAAAEAAANQALSPTPTPTPTPTSNGDSQIFDTGVSPVILSPEPSVPKEKDEGKGNMIFGNQPEAQQPVNTLNSSSGVQ
jgi:hypothetical protein